MATTAPKATSKREPDPAPEAEPVAPKKKSKLLLIVLVLLLLGGGGAAGWYFWPGEDPAAPKKGEAGKAVAAKVAPAKPRTYVPLEPFTVNLQREDGQPPFLQIGLSLKLTDETLSAPVKLAMPEIRSRVLLLLMGKTASELSTPEGKKLLAEQLAREVVQAVPGTTAATGLEAVLFTSFLIQ
ncbi:MAG: flagellar basal body-associated protein FliL [Comamonadaceae bacterium]|nr:MAG: flagellar basal body-associated protein FliL [Comamonadaceae bacterium]